MSTPLHTKGMRACSHHWAEKVKKFYDNGILTKEEYKAQKKRNIARVLGGLFSGNAEITRFLYYLSPAGNWVTHTYYDTTGQKLRKNSFQILQQHFGQVDG